MIFPFFFFFFHYLLAFISCIMYLNNTLGSWGIMAITIIICVNKREQYCLTVHIKSSNGMASKCFDLFGEGVLQPA